MSADLRLRIVAVNVAHRGSLAGTVDLEFAGVRLRGCAVIHGPHGPFVGLPRSAVIGHDGWQRRDASGKLEFNALIEWVDAETSATFQRAALKLIRRDFPALLDDGGAPEQLALPARIDAPSHQPRHSAYRRAPVVAPGAGPPLNDDPVGDLWAPDDERPQQ